MRIAIIGAGMAGLACAEILQTGGHTVRLFDKGRAAGGRMSTRRMQTPVGEARFDHGAQYFTARDPAFRQRVAVWQAAGLVAPWPAAAIAGETAWVGCPGMNAPLRQMAADQTVQWAARVDSLARDPAGWRPEGDGIPPAYFDIAVLALPAEQAAPLLAPWDATLAAHARATPAQPCWTVLAAFPTRLPLDADILRDFGSIGWAARDSAKPGRHGPESWVIQASPDWSAQHLEESADTILPALLNDLATAVGQPLPQPLVAAAHRWRFARSGSGGGVLPWRPELGLGLCGDWLLGPRVECAWLSGTRLAQAILATPVAQPAASPAIGPAKAPGMP